MIKCKQKLKKLTPKTESYLQSNSFNIRFHGTSRMWIFLSLYDTNCDGRREVVEEKRFKFCGGIDFSFVSDGFGISLSFS